MQSLNLTARTSRLIDELRCIWVPKCLQPYVDVGKEGERELFGWR